MRTRQSRGKLIAVLVGESLREMAVLIAVFAPLDIFVQGGSLTVRSTAAIMAIVSTLFALGIFLEVKQSWKD